MTLEELRVLIKSPSVSGNWLGAAWVSIWGARQEIYSWQHRPRCLLRWRRPRRDADH